jgi:hypothetical protein
VVDVAVEHIALAAGAGAVGVGVRQPDPRRKQASRIVWSSRQTTWRPSGSMVTTNDSDITHHFFNRCGQSWAERKRAGRTRPQTKARYAVGRARGIPRLAWRSPREGHFAEKVSTALWVMPRSVRLSGSLGTNRIVLCSADVDHM